MMRITVDIDEEELKEAVMNLVIQNTVKQIEHDLYSDGYNVNRRIYRDEIKNAVRSVIRDEKEELTKRAVEAAAYTISHKALRDKINAVLEE